MTEGYFYFLVYGHVYVLLHANDESNVYVLSPVYRGGTKSFSNDRTKVAIIGGEWGRAACSPISLNFTSTQHMSANFQAILASLFQASWVWGCLLHVPTKNSHFGWDHALRARVCEML